jgi:hypothetical protein
MSAFFGFGDALIKGITLNHVVIPAQAGIY